VKHLLEKSNKTFVFLDGSVDKHLQRVQARLYNPIILKRLHYHGWQMKQLAVSVIL